MRILVLHNFYRSEMPSGEDAVVRQDLDLLAGAGHDVELVMARSDDISSRSGFGKATVPLEVVWSAPAQQQVRRAVRSFRPDVAHVHNTFPLLSPAVVHTLRREGVPTVATLHNYRTLCAQGLFTRDDRPCFDCLGPTTLPAVRHACYRASVPATIPLAMSIQLHRGLGTWSRDVSRLIVMSQDSRRTFLRAGYPAERLVVRGHSVEPPARVRTDAGDGALFVGRLTPEKGALWLVRNWPADAPQLTVIGDGPERDEIELLVANGRPNVLLLGGRTRTEVREAMASARMLVVPSRVPETFGLTAAEAMSVGVPVVGPSIGAVPEVVQDGVGGRIFDVDDPSAMHAAVRELADPATSQRLGALARERYEAHYSPQTSLRSLLAIYHDAINGR